MLSFYRTTLRYQASCYYPSSNGVSELIQHHTIAQIVEVPTATQPTIILRVNFAINCDYAITWFTIPLAFIYPNKLYAAFHRTTPCHRTGG